MALQTTHKLHGLKHQKFYCISQYINTKFYINGLSRNVLETINVFKILQKNFYAQNTVIILPL